jgi:3,5-epimerase/4-reductase
MKLLIFGSNGWIGSMFSDYINNLNDNNIKIIHTNVRADNETLVNDIILAHSPTHIISFVGRTYGDNINNIDYLEQKDKLPINIRDNLFAPIVLSTIAQHHKIHFTYIGTGCIFNNDTDDENHYIYKDNDDPDFFGSSYSIVKGFTDRLIRLNPNNLNLRIRMPITDTNHSRNFITKIINYPKICSSYNSMTIIPDFIPIIFDMIKNKKTGSFNLVNPGIISHNEILEIYKEIINPSHSWKNISISQQNELLKSKRTINHLDNSKILSLYPNIPDIKTSVRNCIIKMKENN